MILLQRLAFSTIGIAIAQTLPEPTPTRGTRTRVPPLRESRKTLESLCYLQLSNGFLVGRSKS